mmetsp:Transcript_34731/g.83935  ORF Transcript_34731/g.83935 Transcript_34731/m.83935 type:complete len:293 (+) Transcript_34731:48-926(+)
MSGEQLVKEAEGKLKSSFFGFVGPKYDEAKELYQNAANQFKLSKDWGRAAECFEKCAECSAKDGSTYGDQASFYEQAASCLKRISVADAVPRYDKASGLYSGAGRFGQAAKLLKQVAECLEEDKALDQAAEYYQRAADLFDMDEFSKSAHSACMLKLAELQALDGKYMEASQVFEKEGNKALQNNLLSFGAKDLFLKAGLMLLVLGDSVTTKIGLDRYRGADPRFADSREDKLLTTLMEAQEERDKERFEDACHEFDSMTKLNGWQTTMLLKAKAHIEPSASAQMGDALDLT